MIRSQFTFQTSDGVQINSYRWQPNKQTELVGIIQLAHGMAEHILRYNDFSRFLASHGFVVYGNDHRGHGHSITAPDDRGYFADENGFELVVDDMYRLSAIAKNEHPDLPLFLFGHSMGSFLTRRYIAKYGDKIAGAIICGTGGDQGIIGSIGLMLAKIEKKRIGARTPSPLLDKLTFGQYNKLIDNPRTAFDFLTHNEAVVDAYVEDELCGFVASAGFFVDLIGGIELIHRDDQVARVPKHLPLFIIAGDEDPVGDFGKAIIKVYEQYRNSGMQHVSMQLYKGARHEILNETNKADVYEDILYWLRHIMKGVEK